MRIELSRVAAVLLVVYAALLIYLTLIMPFTLGPGMKLNLTPFVMMAMDIREGGRAFYVNFLGNVVLFAPIGLLLPVAAGRWGTALRVVAIGMALSVMIETLQWSLGRRVADIDDVILNTVGTWGGYGVWVVARRFIRPGTR